MTTAIFSLLLAAYSKVEAKAKLGYIIVRSKEEEEGFA